MTDLKLPSKIRKHGDSHYFLIPSEIKQNYTIKNNMNAKMELDKDNKGLYFKIRVPALINQTGFNKASELDKEE